MATTKAKKASTKKAPAKRPVAKRKTASKKVVRSASPGKRPLITRSNEYTQLTWVLIGIWLVLIAVFVGTVVGKMG